MGLSMVEKIWDEEGLEELKDKPKSGRRSRRKEKTENGIKTILKQGDQGWMDHYAGWRVNHALLHNSIFS